MDMHVHSAVSTAGTGPEGVAPIVLAHRSLGPFYFVAACTCENMLFAGQNNHSCACGWCIKGLSHPVQGPAVGSLSHWSELQLLVGATVDLL